MPYRCLVWNCKSSGNIPGITYHSLGKDHYADWLSAIGRSPAENLASKNVICSLHFREDDFEPLKRKKVIKRNAIPRVNLPPNVVFRQVTTEDVTQSIYLKPPTKKLRFDFGIDRVESKQTTNLEDDGNIPGSCSARDVYAGISTLKPSDNQPVQQTSSSDSAGLRGSPKRNRKLIKKIHTYATSPEKTIQELKMQRQKINELRIKYKREKRSNKRLRVRVHSLRVIVNQLQNKKLLSQDACLVLEKTFSGD